MGKKSFSGCHDSCRFPTMTKCCPPSTAHLLNNLIFCIRKSVLLLFLPHFLHIRSAYMPTYISSTLINHGGPCPATELSCIAGYILWYIPPVRKTIHLPNVYLKIMQNSANCACFTMFQSNYTIHQLVYRTETRAEAGAPHDFQRKRKKCGATAARPRPAPQRMP